jgi:hypothetical protein
MAYINASGQLDNNLGLMNRFQIAKVTLSAAQINLMFTTPVAVLPALPATQFYAVDSFIVQTKPGSVAFTGGGAVSFQYHGSAVVPHGSSIPAATIQSATGSVNLLPPNSSAALQIPAGLGVDITNITGVFAAGNGTVVVKVIFTVHSNIS